jgi:EAL domain-containing protein (putative c-di-GMP-specific phosphodiesterase class I)
MLVSVSGPEKRMAAPAPVAEPVNLLLVSGTSAWRGAVHHAAGLLGARVHDVGCDVDRAVALLASPRAPYTHLLLDSNCAGDRLDELIGLTHGEAASGMRMVLLGRIDPARAGAIASIPAVHDVDSRLVGRALADHADDTSQPYPALALGVTELREALAGSRIEVRYQPIVRLRDGSHSRTEALARLHHPLLGTLTADMFVPGMEAAGLGASFAEAVVTRVFADITRIAYSAAHAPVAINLSLDVLLSAEARIRLDRLREATGLAASRFAIELTESQTAHDILALGHAVESVRRAGYGLLLDDVTEETPHLDALLSLDFDTVKFDRSVLLGSRASPDFLQRTVERARARGITTTAEGIETARLWEHVAACGVDQAQGFLIARPMPPGALGFWRSAWMGREPFPYVVSDVADCA